MKRIHLFEFEDLSWFPSFIRDGGTDFLGFILRITKFYAPAIELLENVVKKTAHSEIIDLCSGNGGPIELIFQKIDPSLNVKFIISDKYPNIPAYRQLQRSTDNKVDFYPDSLDVLESDLDLPGIRTMFSAIHHFNPEEVKIVLRKMVNKDKTICLFDSGDRHLGIILGILLFHPILFFFITPFLRPFRISRIVFTYLIPLIPLYTIWDGIVSIMRLYSPNELRAIAIEIDIEGRYQWDFGKVRSKIGLSVAFLIGTPIKN